MECRDRQGDNDFGSMIMKVNAREVQMGLIGLIGLIGQMGQGIVVRPARKMQRTRWDATFDGGSGMSKEDREKGGWWLVMRGIFVVK